MALSTLATLDDALKTIYIGPLVKQIDEQSGPVFAKLEKKNRPAPGNAFKFGMQYGRHGGIGAIAEDGDLPTASPRLYKQGSAAVKNLAGRISFTEKLMLTSKTDTQAFANQVTEQISDITKDANDMVRRNLLGSSTGIMTTVKTGATGATAVVVNGNINYFYAGQYLDILTAPSTKSVDGIMVADVDYDTDTIYFASNVTCTADQLITLKGNYTKELTGLTEILTANNTIYTIDRSTAKWFNPHVYSKLDGSATSTFNSLWLQQAIDDISDRTGEKPDFITCDSGMTRAYYEESLTYKRTLEWKNVEGGYKLQSFDDVAISKEKYMPANTFFLINTADFYLAQLADWGWMDDDGKVLSRVANKAAYEASLTKYCELICSRPGGQAKITGITAA